MPDEQRQWDGSERRGIPIHLINYVDERLAVHVDKVEKIMANHVGEEMERYREIIDLIEEKDRRSEDRHHALVQSISAYNAHVELIDGAFLDDEDNGQPDYRGHRKAHKSWAKDGEEEKKVMEFVKNQMNADAKKAEDMRFIIRAIITTVAGAIIMWAGKELIVDAVHSSLPKHPHGEVRN